VKLKPLASIITTTGTAVCAIMAARRMLIRSNGTLPLRHLKLPLSADYTKVSVSQYSHEVNEILISLQHGLPCLVEPSFFPGVYLM
jgi:hypothetical protein